MSVIESINYDGIQVILTASGIRNVLLNRSKRNNAMTIQMFADVTKILNDAANDGDRTKLVYITGGNGNYFSSGNDLLNYFPQEDIDPVELLESATKTFEDYVTAFINFPKLVVVGVNGHAIGAAVTILGLVDIVFASDQATFVTPFSRLGLVAEGCSTYTFPRLMGRAKSMEMLCLGKKISAQEAKERNLVAKIYPHHTFQENVQDVLEDTLNECYTGSFHSIKKLANQGISQQTLHTVNKREIDELKLRLQSPECVEAALKIVTRKKPSINKL